MSSWLEHHVGRIGDLYVARGARGTGAGSALVANVIENLRARGATHLLLNAHPDALRFYERLGFREESRNLVLDLEVREVGAGRSFGGIHVQTDDLGEVERAVRQFVPRLPGASRGSIVSPVRNGWIAVYDDVCDRDPSMLRRLATELSRPDGGGRAVARRRARRGRALRPARGRPRRRRVPLGAGALRPAAARRRDRARGEPARGRATHRRRPRGCARRRAHGSLPERAAAGRRAPRPRSAARSGSRAGSTAGTTRRSSPAPFGSTADADALRRRPLSLLRPRSDRPRREGSRRRRGRDRSLRSAGVALREEPGGEGAGVGGGRLGAARVGRHLRVPRGAAPRAAALAGRRGGARGRAAARLPVRRLLEAVLRAAPRRGGRAGALRGRARPARCAARAAAVPDRASFGLADTAYLPWVLRARDVLGISLEPWPSLSAWVERVSERPSVAAELELLAAL